MKTHNSTCPCGHSPTSVSLSARKPMRKMRLANTMFTFLTKRSVVLVFLALLLGNAEKANSQSLPNTPVFMPYCDVTLWPPYDIQNTSTTNVCNYILAFVVDDPTKPGANPCWGGFSSYDTSWYQTRIQQLRMLGGDVAVSFGGANGSELATVATSVPSLVSAYQLVIDAYHLKYIDFDIEGANVADSASINLRSQAIAQLKQNNPGLKVWLTLPVLPTGLDYNGLKVARNAIVKYGIDIDGVNIMAMDYGAFSGNMGGYAVQAADSLFAQLTRAYVDGGFSKTSAQIWKKVGLTPMIGQNDVVNEVFYLSDATTLYNYSTSNNTGLISMWSINRDKPCANSTDPLYSCTHITQNPFDFTNIFRGNNGSLNYCNMLTGGATAAPGFTWAIVPNPAHDKIKVMGRDEHIIKDIAIFDLCGNMVLKQNRVETTIDISSLASGIYFLEISSTEGNTRTKFIKE